MKLYRVMITFFLVSCFGLFCFADCPSSDLTGDCVVNFHDLNSLAERWLNDCNMSNDWCGGSDFNGDCLVDFADFAVMASQRMMEEAVVVPDVIGLSLEDAKAAIIDAYLIVGTVSEEYSDIVTTGCVMSQNPSGEENVVSGVMVGLVISLGPEVIEPDIMWVSIIDEGVVGELDGFIGEMSKYETTNAQYCWFLNDALATGEIIVGTDNYVYGANGSNSGADFAGQVYYYLAGPGGLVDGAYNGGASRINYTGSEFTVDNGFENHPLTYVSWYGATAFGNYYGWRLPTEWEWQAVADYDGSFVYGCGPTINNSIANYCNFTHPYGTTSVGSFGTYGYGMADMVGNVWEWTSSSYSWRYRVNRGGGWGKAECCCKVAFRGYDSPRHTGIYVGFRVCRDIIVVPDVVGMTLLQAQEAIADSGLVVGTIIEQYSDIVAADNVISQNPLCGENVLAGAVVDLVISLGPESTDPDITWISISDPGIGGEFEGFTGEMSKYETTNAQYCYFLNEAIATGDIYVENDYVKGASGSNSGEDFIGQIYYNLAGSGWSSDGATNGGASRIIYNDGVFSVDNGFENHPVTHVSWFGATSFASYYGWRLPTEWQWQGVADYDGSYNYGCGTAIDNSKANYRGSIHPYGITAVGDFGMYGYGVADMAGNVNEWTSSVESDGSDLRLVCGGSWDGIVSSCLVSNRYCYRTDSAFYNIGFRVCR